MESNFNKNENTGNFGHIKNKIEAGTPPSPSRLNDEAEDIMAPKAWDHRVVNPLNPYENFDSENDDGPNQNDDQLHTETQDQVDGDNLHFQVAENIENHDDDTISFSISQSE